MADQVLYSVHGHVRGPDGALTGQVRSYLDREEALHVLGGSEEDFEARSISTHPVEEGPTLVTPSGGSSLVSVHTDLDLVPKTARDLIARGPYHVLRVDEAVPRDAEVWALDGVWRAGREPAYSTVLLSWASGEQLRVVPTEESETREDGARARVFRVSAPATDPKAEAAPTKGAAQEPERGPEGVG